MAFHEKINSTENGSALNTLGYFEYIILTLSVHRLTKVINDVYSEKVDIGRGSECSVKCL